MKRWQRNTLRTGGALALLGLLALVAAHVLLDPEKLKALAREKAQAAWSRELSVGALELGFFPVPWIRADDVSFANPGWASERRFFHAERHFSACAQHGLRRCGKNDGLRRGRGQRLQHRCVGWLRSLRRRSRGERENRYGHEGSPLV